MWQLKTIESPTIAVRCSASCGLLNPIEKGIARALEMQFRIHNYSKDHFLFSHFRKALFFGLRPSRHKCFAQKRGTTMEPKRYANVAIFRILNTYIKLSISWSTKQPVRSPFIVKAIEQLQPLPSIIGWNTLRQYTVANSEKQTDWGIGIEKDRVKCRTDYKVFYNHKRVHVGLLPFCPQFSNFFYRVCCNNVPLSPTLLLTDVFILGGWLASASTCQSSELVQVLTTGILDRLEVCWLLFFPLSCCPRVRCIDSETTLSNLPLVYLPSMHLSFPSHCKNPFSTFMAQSFSLWRDIKVLW